MPVLNETRRQINDEFNTIVGCNVRHWRNINRFTLNELSEAAHMAVSTLQRVENGERSLKLRDAIEIARILQVKPESLCRRQRGVSYIKE